ncbi:DUF563-containing protein [Aureococcus anophagefferens]|nr:DUF563-containing protein [Aureococcus anophagefferens]
MALLLIVGAARALADAPPLANCTPAPAEAPVCVASRWAEAALTPDLLAALRDRKENHKWDHALAHDCREPRPPEAVVVDGVVDGAAAWSRERGTCVAHWRGCRPKEAAAAPTCGCRRVAAPVARFRAAAPARPTPGAALLVTRAGDGPHRRVRNWGAVRAVVEARFDTVLHHDDAGDIGSLDDQLDRFARAEVVVAPHGAALVGLPATAPGACVVEYLPENYLNLCFAGVARRLNRTYRAARVDARGEADVAALPAMLDACVAARGAPAPARRTALCVVGQERTFAHPLVAASIGRLARLEEPNGRRAAPDFRADVFLALAAAPSPDAAAALAAMGGELVAVGGDTDGRWPNCTGPGGAAGYSMPCMGQWAKFAACARAVEAREDATARRYDVVVKLRTDAAVPFQSGRLAEFLAGPVLAAAAAGARAAWLHPAPGMEDTLAFLARPALGALREFYDWRGARCLNDTIGWCNPSMAYYAAKAANVTLLKYDTRVVHPEIQRTFPDGSAAPHEHH